MHFIEFVCVQLTYTYSLSSCTKMKNEGNANVLVSNQLELEILLIVYDGILFTKILFSTH